MHRRLAVVLTGIALSAVFASSTGLAAGGDVPAATIELPKTDNLVTFRIRMATGRTFTLRAREGSMVQLTNDADVSLRFVVARDENFGNRFVLRQVLAEEKMVDGKPRYMLHVDQPVEFGTLSPNLTSAGVTATSLVGVSKIAPPG